MANTTTARTATCVEDFQAYPNTMFRIIRNITKSANTSEVKVADNVTLIFDGGCISGNFKLVGNKTSIQAPIAQIFDGVAVEGDWICDRAYPQWFDSEAGKQGLIDKDSSENPEDCSPAINAAIKMKRVGEVLLPAGNYYVSHPIIMSYGIQLTGEACGKTMAAASTGELVRLKVESRIIPFIEAINGLGVDGFGEQAILELNIDRSSGTLSWQFNHPQPTSTIRGIVFDNCYERLMVLGGTKGQNASPAITQTNTRILTGSKVCCLVAGGFLFENSYWHDFRRAIKVSNDYADIRTVRHCVFTNDLYKTGAVLNSLEEKQYIVDLGRSGDALVLDNCAFHTPPLRDGFSDGALCLASCKGGSITNNILNRDVRFVSCKDVVFAGNHMEYGAQLRLENSSMSVNNNHFEKGKRPSIIIDAAGESSRNDTSAANFRFSELQITANTFMTWFNRGKADSTDTSENKISRISITEACDFEIGICTLCNAPYDIRLSRNYRHIYLTGVDSPDLSSHPTGIQVGKFANDPEQLTAFSEFNRYSHILSTDAAILPMLAIEKHKLYTAIPTLTAKIQSNEHVMNAQYPEYGTTQPESNWQYRYYGQVVLDPARGICGPEFEFSRGTYDVRYGNLIALGRLPGGTSCQLRIRRVSKDGNQQSVEVPLCGCHFIYDNYYCVNGHRWLDGALLSLK